MTTMCCSANHCHCFQPRYNYKLDPKALEKFGEIFNCPGRKIDICDLDRALLALRNLSYIYDICTHCGEIRESANW